MDVEITTAQQRLHIDKIKGTVKAVLDSPSDILVTYALAELAIDLQKGNEDYVQEVFYEVSALYAEQIISD